MNAIPTFALGVQFRSRLEARWAWMFKLMGFAWHYEPFDLRNWIPDFKVAWGPGVEVLVEVKPGSHWDELSCHAPRIAASGWEGHALIVGSTVPLATPTSPRGGLCIGHLVGTEGGPAFIFGHGERSHLGVGLGVPADVHEPERERLIGLWLRAGNETQWKKPDPAARKAWDPADDAEVAAGGREVPSVEETQRMLAEMRKRDDAGAAT